MAGSVRIVSLLGPTSIVGVGDRRVFGGGGAFILLTARRLAARSLGGGIEGVANVAEARTTVRGEGLGV